MGTTVVVEPAAQEGAFARPQPPVWAAPLTAALSASGVASLLLISGGLRASTLGIAAALGAALAVAALILAFGVMSQPLLSVACALVVAHGCGLLLFDGAIRAVITGDVLRAHRQALHEAQAAVDKVAGDLRAINAQRAQAYLLAQERYWEANLRLLRAEHFDGCPAQWSPGYQGSVCQIEKEAMRAARAAQDASSGALTDTQPPFAARLKTAQGRLADVRDHDLDRRVAAARGVFADVGYLGRHLHTHPAEFWAYLIIFAGLFAVDLKAQRELGSRPVTTRVAQSLHRADEAAAERAADRARRAVEQAERDVALEQHALAIGRLRGAPLDPVFAARVRERVLSVLPAPGAVERMIAADPLERLRDEPDTPVLAVGHVLSGTQRWRVERQAQVPGRTAANNGVYWVVSADDSEVRGFLKLYNVPSAEERFSRATELLRARADNELRVLQEVNCFSAPPFLPKLLDRSRPGDGSIVWTVTEVCDFDAREWAAAHTPLRLLDVLQLATDVLKALEFSRFIHGDIKPQNVLAYPDEHGRWLFRLTDWETAHRPRDGLTPVIQRATPAFAAPDVGAGAEPSPLDDLYGLGATLWWLCTGRYVGELEGLLGPSGWAQATQQTQACTAVGDNDLFWLAVHRHYGSDGCYRLGELLPPSVPANFTALVDRLLVVPSAGRTPQESRRVDDIAAELLEEVHAIRETLQAQEAREREPVLVGPTIVSEPSALRPIAIDAAWRTRYRAGERPYGTGESTP